MATPLPPSPFIIPKRPRNVDDVVANLDRILSPQTYDRHDGPLELDPAPLFIRDPSPQYMRACEIMPIVTALTAHLR